MLENVERKKFSCLQVNSEIRGLNSTFHWYQIQKNAYTDGTV